MRMRRGGLRPHPLTILLLGLLAAAGAFLLARHDPKPHLAAAAPTWEGLVGAPRAQPLTGQPALGQEVIVVFRARSLADRVTAAGGEATSAEEQQWTKDSRTDQHVLMQQLSFRGAVLQPTARYTRVVNAIAVTVDPGTLAILEHAPEVAGIYPVRAAYPATVPQMLESAAFAAGSGHRPDIGLEGVDGRGIEIALLDTGVDPTHPFLRGQIEDGIDVVGGSPHALPAASPDDPSEVERHGTEMAGLLVGAGGPGGLSGVATGASILPIRVAGWQPTDDGKHSIYATTDQVMQGLEDAVDPNGDGDAHDAVRVALLAVAEPYASFPDDPVARAVEGASRLDTLVVAPAGNDGAAGASYGSIAGPGGAKDGLTVGALDARRESNEVRILVREGLKVVVDESAPLGTESVGGKSVSVPLVAVAAARGEGQNALDPVPVERFFDASGFSRAAGRAVLVPAGGSPEAVARNAAAAGASAVVLYGDSLPAGAVRLDTPTAIPVVAVAAATGKELAAALARHQRLAVVIGASRATSNPDMQRVASFSSRGLALGGTFKPELAARGVELATSDPGQGADGEGAYTTVSGTSAAAALAAGAATLLAQARPDLSAAELRAALTESARPLPGEPLLAQGAGELDLGAAADLPAVALPATLDFGHADRKRGWHAVRTLMVRNTLSTPISLFVTSHATGPAAAVILEPTPDRVLQLDPHRTQTLSLLVRLAPGARVRTRSAQGVLVLSTSGGETLRIPWTLALPAPPRLLLQHVHLSRRAFQVSASVPAVLALDVGRVVPVGSGSPEGPRTVPAIVPAARLALDLWNEEGQRLGTLAALTNVLPGRYSFGITGRSPAGADLEPGRYAIKIIARPLDGTASSVKTVRFTILAPPASTTATLTAP